jgi:hypothetical protein
MGGSEVYVERSYLPFPVLSAYKLFSVPKRQWKLKLRWRSRWTLADEHGNTKSWLFYTHQSLDPLAMACNSYGRHGKSHQFLWVTSFPQCNRWTSTIDKISVLLPTLFRQYQKAQVPNPKSTINYFSLTLACLPFRGCNERTKLSQWSPKRIKFLGV